MIIDSWLKLEKSDNINFNLLKQQLTVPNPDFVSRSRMGFKTFDYQVFGKCISCKEEIQKMVQYRKDIPKVCKSCDSPLKVIADPVEIDRFDRLYQEVGEQLWVPRALISRYPAGIVTDNTTLGDREIDFKSVINLGPNDFITYDQHKFVDSLFSALKNYYGAIGQAPPGSGKTVMGLEVVARLGRPAIVLVHKEFLMNQWAERIMECFDINKDEVGFIQQDVVDFQGKKIVIAMIQSLIAREYPKSLFDYFGTVISDECHRIGSLEWRKVIPMFPSRYRIGLTATPKRKDGLENIFFWHIGEISAVGDSNKLKPKIKFVKTNLDPTDRDLRMMRDYSGKQNLNRVITYLIESGERNEIIVDLIAKALKAGRKIIVLSGRLAHLETLNKMIKLKMIEEGERFTIGYYIGGMSEEERTISATRQLMLCTYAMAEEGLDIPDLDTLFLVTPKSSVEQAAGRILRTFSDKKEPVIVDITDPIEICVNMSKKRIRSYQKLGYI